MQKWPNKAQLQTAEFQPNQSQDDLSLTGAMKQYVLMARVDGRARKTIELYHYVFDSFTEFINDPPLSEVNTASIRSYLASLKDRGLKKTTVAIHHRVLQALFNWLVEEGYLKRAPTDRISSPRTPKKFPYVLDDQQVSTLLNLAKAKSKSWVGYRNYTIVVTFLDVGLRLNELINLELGDLSIPNRSLKVHGKGAKDRICFMGSRCHKTLRRWIKMRSSQGRIWDDTVFIYQRGERMKHRYVQQIIADLKEDAGLEGVRVSPHTLRHTAATLAVQNGLDVFSLKRQFGWEQVDTAMKYVHMSGRGLQEAFSRASPVDRIIS